jgi:hypothetical protein
MQEELDHVSISYILDPKFVAWSSFRNQASQTLYLVLLSAYALVVGPTASWIYGVAAVCGSAAAVRLLAVGIAWNKAKGSQLFVERTFNSKEHFTKFAERTATASWTNYRRGPTSKRAWIFVQPGCPCWLFIPRASMSDDQQLIFESILKTASFLPARQRMFPRPNKDPR